MSTATPFHSIAGEEGWLRGVIKALKGDFVYLDRMNEELEHEKHEGRRKAIEQAMDVRVKSMQEMVMDACDRLDLTDKMAMMDNERKMKEASQKGTLKHLPLIPEIDSPSPLFLKDATTKNLPEPSIT